MKFLKTPSLQEKTRFSLQNMFHHTQTSFQNVHFFTPLSKIFFPAAKCKFPPRFARVIAERFPTFRVFPPEKFFPGVGPDPGKKFFPIEIAPARFQRKKFFGGGRARPPPKNFFSIPPVVIEKEIFFSSKKIFLSLSHPLIFYL